MSTLAATNLKHASSASNNIVLNSSGNVGIGTSSPSYRFEIPATGAVAANLGGILIGANGTDIKSNTGILRLQSTGANPMQFDTNNSERMRIDSSGNLLVGKTSTVSDVTTVGAFIQNNGKGVFTTTDVVQPLVVAKNANTAGAMIEFYYNGATVGSITTNGTGVTYGTASDYRLKNSVVPLGSGLSLIDALRPVTYKWNVDDSYGEGFIAHELQAVIPAAVTGEKDAVNENGSIKPQGVDYSKIVVHLVAAIQELKADFDAYKAAHP